MEEEEDMKAPPFAEADPLLGRALIGLTVSRKTEVEELPVGEALAAAAVVVITATSMQV